MSWDLSARGQLKEGADQKEKSNPKKESPTRKSASDRKVLTVSDLNSQIKGQLESNFPRFWLKGELSNFTAHGSGHWYFSLKDNKSQISGVMFRGSNNRVKFKPKTGQEVIVFGRISVYEPRGNYQVYVEHMEPVGAGALQQAFEDLKRKLREEGLFDPKRKKPLPEHPKHIAIVTSPTGAAIRDMLNVLRRRYRSAVVTIIPTVVQGEAAAPHIVKALRAVDTLKNVDVVIVGRGGGSMEDLWCFNDERVARAIVDCKHPVISAVGHEIDFTISDFVADLRAPTPSAAAELVAANSEELLQKLKGLFKYLVQSMDRRLGEKKLELHQVSHRLVDPRRTLQDFIQRNDELFMRMQRVMHSQLRERKIKLEGLYRSMEHPRRQLMRAREQLTSIFQRLQGKVMERLSQQRQRLGQQSALLDSLSPLRVLDRGYALVQKQDEVVKSVKQIKAGDELKVRLAQGQLDVEVKSLKE